jgi:hypothetical protein
VYFLGGKGGRCVRLTTSQPSCARVMKSGNLNFLEPSGPLQACNGTASPSLILFAQKRHGCSFSGGWVYPRTRECNFTPLTKITIQSPITQLVFTLKLRNTDMNNSVSGSMTPCRLVHYYQLVGRTCCLHLYSLTVLKTESKASTLVLSRAEDTHRYIREDRNIGQRYCESLKTHAKIAVYPSYVI